MQNISTVELKTKEINDKLNNKTKELRNKDRELKKAEKSIKELNEKLNTGQKKISELENTNTRLNLMLDQAKDAVSSKSVRKRDKNESPPRRRESTENSSSSKAPTPKASPTRCSYDNTGKCRKGRNCQNIHAKQTCHVYSKLGQCQLGSQCEFRHPAAICNEWRELGTCRYGDECRYSHPLVITPHVTGNFLDQNVAQNHQWPGYSHRDQRGNRW